MSVAVREGHIVTVLDAMPERSVHLAVTSCPYWSLRWYQTPPQVWPPLGIRIGAAEYETACNDGRHEWQVERTRENEQGEDEPLTWVCTRCNAWLGEHGQEATPERFVWHVVWWARSLRRVLRDDGTFWLNIGDSYFTDPGGQNGAGGVLSDKAKDARRGQGRDSRTARKHPYLKPGDQVGIPDMVRRALLEDGWRRGVRITLTKKAPMPESLTGWRFEQCRVKVANGGLSRRGDPSAIGGWPEHTDTIWDGVKPAEWADCPGCAKCADHAGLILRKGSWRPTSATEVLFLFAKSKKYYADQDAIRVPVAQSSIQRASQNNGHPVWNGNRQRDYPGSPQTMDVNRFVNPAGRNAWDYLEWRTEPSNLAHWAAYPTFIPDFAIRAGTAERICGSCSAPYARVVERRSLSRHELPPDHEHYRPARYTEKAGANGTDRGQRLSESQTLGWRPTCTCGAPPGKSVVLDPFGGSGTTAVVAERLGRDSVLVELNPKYAAMSEKRLRQDSPLFAEVHTNGSVPQAAQLDLFAAPTEETGD